MASATSEELISGHKFTLRRRGRSMVADREMERQQADSGCRCQTLRVNGLPFVQGIETALPNDRYGFARSRPVSMEGSSPNLAYR